MGINTPKKNRVDQTSSDQALIDGLNKHEAAIPAVVIAGITVATKALVTTVQSRIDSSKPFCRSGRPGKRPFRTIARSVTRPRRSSPA
jgi:hypothetical protein